MKTKPTPRPKAARNGHPGSAADAEVLTLSEAAVYLRMPEADVLRMAESQGLAGQKVPDGWRFLKSAIQDWLRAPRPKRQGILAHIGAFKDDPTLDGMVDDIYRRRGRPHAEGD